LFAAHCCKSYKKAENKNLFDMLLSLVNSRLVFQKTWKVEEKRREQKEGNKTKGG
jgi:hypothetical protein